MALVTITTGVDEKDKAGFEPFFSEMNMAYIKKSVQELRNGKGTVHQLIEIDETDKCRAANTLISKLKKAEERADKEGWISADELETVWN